MLFDYNTKIALFPDCCGGSAQLLAEHLNHISEGVEFLRGGDVPPHGGIPLASADLNPLDRAGHVVNHEGDAGILFTGVEIVIGFATHVAGVSENETVVAEEVGGGLVIHHIYISFDYITKITLFPETGWSMAQPGQPRKPPLGGTGLGHSMKSLLFFLLLVSERVDRGRLCEHRLTEDLLLILSRLRYGRSSGEQGSQHNGEDHYLKALTR